MAACPLASIIALIVSLSAIGQAAPRHGGNPTTTSTTTASDNPLLAINEVTVTMRAIPENCIYDPFSPGCELYTGGTSDIPDLCKHFPDGPSCEQWNAPNRGLGESQDISTTVTLDVALPTITIRSIPEKCKHALDVPGCEEYNGGIAGDIPEKCKHKPYVPGCEKWNAAA